MHRFDELVPGVWAGLIGLAAAACGHQAVAETVPPDTQPQWLRTFGIVCAIAAGASLATLALAALALFELTSSDATAAESAQSNQSRAIVVGSLASIALIAGVVQASARSTIT